MFEMSYNSGSIPDDWKLANVVPVHKKGSKSNVENYRPISLTSLIMKQYEKIVRKRLMDLVGDMISSKQHGFLPFKSCQTQLVAFIDSLHQSLNSGYHTDVIYFDFSKAFDSVNHDILLHKLKYQFNIDGKLLRFLKSYLENRKQQVVIGNVSSDWSSVQSGVPQGSIVGPLLFVLFINDITSKISVNTNIALYADDTKIWRNIHSINDNISLQTDIDSLFNWSIENKMSFNLGKCKVLPISRKNNVSIDDPSNFKYSLGSEAIKYCLEEKDLGVYITHKANFSSHCDKIYSKANSRLGLTRRSCHFVKNEKQKRTIYLTMIRSLFEHCSSIWHPKNQSSMIIKLESLQRRSIKWILNEEYSSYSPIEYFIRCKLLKILPLSQKLILNDLLFFHAIVNMQSPAKLPAYMKFYDNGSSRQLRTSHYDRLCLISSISPKISHSYSHNLPGGSEYKTFENSFFYRTHLLWNRLPISIRELNHTKFKAKVIEYLWQESFSQIITQSEDHDTSIIDQASAMLPQSFYGRLNINLSTDAE